MRTLPLIAPLLAGIALAAAPAAAEGKKDRAQEAVAAARAKVEIANKLGATGEVPRLQAAAAAALRTAEEDLKGNHKDQAIADANRAEQLAEEAIGYTQRNQAANADAQVNAATAGAAAAQDQAAQAQAAADAANARAASAEQAAAAAQADAAAARAAPPVVVTTPAPATTATVTTETTAPAAPAATTRKVVRKPVRHTAARAGVKTTTTVTTN